MHGTHPIRTAFQGEPGAFSEAAARRLLGDRMVAVARRTFEETFAAVEAGEADCSITPIENSLAGSIHRNYDLLLQSNLTIAGETVLRIVHHLIAPPGVALSDVLRVYSHPVALAQCSTFFAANPQLEAHAVDDTAGAVRLVMQRSRRDEAAIASDSAAVIYGGTVIASGIESHPQNFTRFLLLAKHDANLPVAGDARGMKTSLIVRLPNKPGSLHRALGAFAELGIDLTKIESRPVAGRPWEYAFYLDVMGAHGERPLAQALGRLAESAEEVRVLGSYAAAEQP
ncbi:MAG: prephenate dehydratase [Gemmatimonadaceae bacterium]